MGDTLSLECGCPPDGLFGSGQSWSNPEVAREQSKWTGKTNQKLFSKSNCIFVTK